MNKIKVVVVDDSLFMRKAMQNMLADEPDIEIIGIGKDGEEAVKLAETLKPDIITLDIEMPKMDGLTALGKIMKSAPTTVIMVSSLTKEGSEITLKALDMGAVDFITKETSFGGASVNKIGAELKDKIRHFANSKHLARRFFAHKAPIAETAKPAPRLSSASAGKKAVALGTSTGGPQSLQQVIPLLPADLGVPVFIVQHMPPNFTKSLATRLDSLSAVTVTEAVNGEDAQPNHVYIAPGGQQMTISKIGSKYVINVKPAIPGELHNPSVDIMVESVAAAYGRDTLGVIMTGMGNDGTKGLTKLKSVGGFIVSQDEESCVVYGMPKSVVDSGIADEVVPLSTIASRIAFHCKR